MDTPQTDSIDTYRPFIVSEPKYKAMAELSRQLERELTAEQEKVRELREALSILEQQIDYGQVDVALDYVRAILEKTK
jgi:uncharacterized protein YeeX (DUF496 family)